jgi:glycosyltransferase 2 family protein
VRALKIVYLLLGVGLLAAVVAEIELAEVADQVARVGIGFAFILTVYLVAFIIDSVTWQLTIAGVPLDATWAYRVWRLRMVGEAFNTVMPGAGMGGEPVKAVLLKKHHGIGYREATASLILAKTINMIALVAFLIVGFVLMITGAGLPTTFVTVATTGLAVLGVAVLLFYVIQRFGVTGLTGTWLRRWHFAKRLDDVLHHIHDMDERLVGFYAKARSRFAVALALAFVNWLLGVVEVYVALVFLGHPVSWADAWIIEASAQLVRTGAFFIPAAIGAQEGAFLLVCGAITGSPSLGFSVSMVRRLREIIWVAWGFALGSLLSLKSDSNSNRDSERR